MSNWKDIYVKKLGLILFFEEGGYFSEIYWFFEMILVEGCEGIERSLFIIIFYLIVFELGGKNFFNKNKSDIIYFFYDGWLVKYIFII